MARWKTYRQTSRAIALVYVNGFTHTVQQVAVLRPDTSSDMIVDWIVTVGNADVRDVIELHDGRVLHVFPGRVE